MKKNNRTNVLSNYPPKRLKPTVFISYSFHDLEHPIFNGVIGSLREDTLINLWDPVKEIKKGDELITKISKAITDSDYFLCIISKERSSRQWPQQELYIAYVNQLAQQKAKIVPVLIDSVPLPKMLQSITPIDLAKDAETGLRNLNEKIHEVRNNLLVQFPIETAYRPTITQVSNSINSRLIEYFSRNPRDIKILDRRKFEELVAELFSGFGYLVELTKQTKDGGRDIVAIKTKEVNAKFLIECKRPDPAGYVGISPIRALYGVKVHEKATMAILATTAHFSREALLFFEDHRWELEPRDYDGILAWINEYMSLFPVR